MPSSDIQVRSPALWTVAACRNAGARAPAAQPTRTSGSTCGGNTPGERRRASGKANPAVNMAASRWARQPSSPPGRSAAKASTTGADGHAALGRRRQPPEQSLLLPGTPLPHHRHQHENRQQTPGDPKPRESQRHQPQRAENSHRHQDPARHADRHVQHVVVIATGAHDQSLGHKDGDPQQDRGQNRGGRKPRSPRGHAAEVPFKEVPRVDPGHQQRPDNRLVNCRVGTRIAAAKMLTKAAITSSRIGWQKVSTIAP